MLTTCKPIPSCLTLSIGFLLSVSHAMSTAVILFQTAIFHRMLSTLCPCLYPSFQKYKSNHVTLLPKFSKSLFGLKSKIQKFSHDLQRPKWSEIYYRSPLSILFLASFIPAGFLAGPKKAVKAQGSCICGSLYLESTLHPVSDGHLLHFSSIFPQIVYK